MKLLFTLLCLLSSTFSWAIYTPIAYDCDIFILADKTEIEVQLIRIDLNDVFYKLCNKKEDAELKIDIAEISEIILAKDRFDSSDSDQRYCEKLTLTNQDVVLVQDVRIDSTYLYFHRCGKAALPEQKLRLNFIAKRERSQTTIPSSKQKKTKNKREIIKKQEEKILENQRKTGATILGFVLPPLVGVGFSDGEINLYLLFTLAATFLLAIILAAAEKASKVKGVMVKFALVGAVLGAILVPAIINLLSN